MSTNKRRGKTACPKFIAHRLRSRLLGIVMARLPEKTIFHPIELGRYVRERFTRPRLRTQTA